MQRAIPKIRFQLAPHSVQVKDSDFRCASVSTGQSTLLCPCAAHLFHVPLKNLLLPAQSGFLCPYSSHWSHYPSKCRCLTGCSPLPLPSCVFLSPLFLPLPLPFFTLATFTVQGANIHGHKIWRIRFSNLLCAWCLPRLSSTQVVMEQLSHMTQLRRFLPHLHMQCVRTSFGDREINTATSTSSCSGALAVLICSSVAFSQSFIRCKNCSLVPKSHARVSFSNAKSLDLVFG